MIYAEPKLDDTDWRVLDLIGKQRQRLAVYTQNSPRRWMGSLRRRTFARAIQGSNSIEGYNATLDQAITAVDGEAPSDERDETWLAIRGYRQAMTYIMQAARDPYFEFSRQFLKSLHFMMVGHELSKNPGQWRPGAVYVVNQNTGAVVYEAPDVDKVNDLVDELVDYVKAPAAQDILVKGAMAHLNLTMIHPYSDGNGRVARAIQTLVLAMDGLLHPVFSSIEEWLGRNTEAYYAVLASVGNGTWSPRRSAHEWVRFCLKAHHQQASTILRRLEEYEALYARVDAIVKRERLNERTAVPLFDAALGTRMTNSRYQSDADVNVQTATRDLKKLSDLGLLQPQGERRGRSYLAGQELVDLRQAVRITRPVRDPYELVSESSAEQPSLPGFEDPSLD